jgi:hypothetical protein
MLFAYPARNQAPAVPNPSFKGRFEVTDRAQRLLDTPGYAELITALQPHMQTIHDVWPADVVLRFDIPDIRTGSLQAELDYMPHPGNLHTIKGFFVFKNITKESFEAYANKLVPKIDSLLRSCHCAYSQTQASPPPVAE